MPLKLEIISEHREFVGDDAVREFRSEGGTIGRSLHNDWILPDPDRFISGKHATIDRKGGIYYIVDISTNGVYINDERKPIGKGKPRRLFNGDHLHVGDFEILVSIDEGEDLDMPKDPKPTVVPDHIEQLVEEDQLRTGEQLLDEDEITGDIAFESILLAGDAEEEPAGPSAAEDPEIPQESGPPILPSGEPGPSRVRLADDDLFDAFLDGLQVSREELHPSVDAAEALQNAGEVLRELICGVEKLLQNRADLKSAFRLDQTTILPRHNNPIKLSRDASDLVKQLLVGREGEYLGPRDAVREVCQDLLAHQEAFLEAMTHAFIEFAERFDPEELAASFEHSLGRKPFFRLLNELRYWGLYKDLYPTMTEKGGGSLPHVFAEGFVRAYERHVMESLLERHPGHPLPGAQPAPPSEEASTAEPAAEAPDEPVDQAEHMTDKAPGSVLEDIAELSGRNELVDFDDLEAQFNTVVFDDDAGQAKG